MPISSELFSFVRAKPFIVFNQSKDSIYDLDQDVYSELFICAWNLACESLKIEPYFVKKAVSKGDTAVACFKDFVSVVSLCAKGYDVQLNICFKAEKHIIDAKNMLFEMTCESTNCLSVQRQILSKFFKILSGMKGSMLLLQKWQIFSKAMAIARLHSHFLFFLESSYLKQNLNPLQIIPKKIYISFDQASFFVWGQWLDLQTNDLNQIIINIENTFIRIKVGILSLDQTLSTMSLGVWPAKKSGLRAAQQALDQYWTYQATP